MIGHLGLITIFDAYQPILEATVRALGTILTFKGILYIVIGTAIGLFFGALPGFGGILGMVLVFPVVYQLTPELGFVMLAATLGGGSFGASLPAISLNVPGTAGSVATCWDGHPMAQKGEMSRAIGASAMASASGAVVGLILLVASLPILREVILLFAAPEIFMVAVMGLVIIGLMAKDAPVRGMVVLFLGLTISFIGFHPPTQVERFTLFGDLSGYLYAGVPLIPIALGLYAISEAMRLVLHVDHIGGEKDGPEVAEQSDEVSVFTGIRDTIENWHLFLRSSALGWMIGLLPGVGGIFANVMAYTQGKSFSDIPDQWGTGIPQGVIAPEAAVDAKDGGATIPTFTFGVPGSGAQVFFLAGMTANGLFPGADMLSSNLHVTMSIILGLLFSNLLTSTFGLFAGGFISRMLSNFRPNPIAAMIILLTLIGSYSINSNVYDLFGTVIFGLIGYVMWRYSYPRILFLITVVIGPIIDKMFGQSYQLFGPAFLTRPLTVLIVVIAIGSMLVSYRNVIRGVISR